MNALADIPQIMQLGAFGLVAYAFIKGIGIFENVATAAIGVMREMKNELAALRTEIRSRMPTNPDS